MSRPIVGVFRGSVHGSSSATICASAIEIPSPCGGKFQVGVLRKKPNQIAKIPGAWGPVDLISRWALAHGSAPCDTLPWQRPTKYAGRTDIDNSEVLDIQISLQLSGLDQNRGIRLCFYYIVLVSRGEHGGED